jgi:hypothetical protein
MNTKARRLLVALTLQLNRDNADTYIVTGSCLFVITFLALRGIIVIIFSLFLVQCGLGNGPGNEDKGSAITLEKETTYPASTAAKSA